MTAGAQTTPVRGYRSRGVAQVIFILIGQSIGFAGYLLTALNRDNALPAQWPTIAVCWYGLGLILAFGTRVALPWADPIILPIVLTLTGLGLAMLHRLDLTSDVAAMLPGQYLSVILGVAALLVIIFLVKDPRRLRGYPYLFSALGFILLLLPLIPGLGSAAYGSRIWIFIGSFSFQPAEVAKLVLAASFAAYLADKREVLSSAGRRVLGLELPRMRDLGPVLVMWGLSLAIMVFENDLGTSLLFFGMFIMMVYVATGRVSWVILGLILFGAGGAAALRFAGHVQRRLDFWLHPFDFPDNATQIIQAQFGLSHGGLFGSGWGLGKPDLVIFAQSDMISAALGEEIGIVGLMAIIILYAVFVFRGLKSALVALDPFVKLLGAGLSFAFLLQVFAIIGGVTRLLPLTGLTTPFLSQGGSSMIANWILVAGLLMISNQARQPQSELIGTTPGGITVLEDEATQVLTQRELAQIGTGATRPVQSIDVQQVRLRADGSAFDPQPAGNDELTVVVSGDGVPVGEDPTVAVPMTSQPPTRGATDPTTRGPSDAAATGSVGAGEATVNLQATQPFDPFADEDLGVGQVGGSASATTDRSGVGSQPGRTPGTDSQRTATSPTPVDDIIDDPFADDMFGRGTE
ncbi:MAG: FtsW/RodA/SpoVE family cell cycle protein [Propionibacteriaceae bacterium]|nr:FtsW/RodA/SpoVE family cell cycle protein [Propionibacteriaceae bacterium]